MEQEFITNLRSLVSPTHPNLRLGIGDDAAILTPNASYFGDAGTVVTVDLLTEGVDFLLAEVDPILVGRKALAVNLSDLAAMAAVPTAVVLAVALPKTAQKTAVGTLDSLALAERLFQGIHPLAERYNVAIAGGDTNTWDGELVISITALGRTTEHGPIFRSGIQSGDHIFVTGPLGGSLLEHQFTFEPRIRESLILNAYYEIHAAIDISDGLTLDLARMLQASNGSLCAILRESAIPVSQDAYRMKDTLTPCEHALYDGEDFELLFTVSEATARELRQTQPLLEPFQVTLYEIGSVEQATQPDSLLFLYGNDGTVRKLQPRGFLH